LKNDRRASANVAMMIKIVENQVGMFRKISFQRFFDGPDKKNGLGRLTVEHSLVLGLD
jgi:hypothetical protein